MLVYASEKAMNHPIQAVPKNLEVRIHTLYICTSNMISGFREMGEYKFQVRI